MEDQIIKILADYVQMPPDEIHRDSQLQKDLHLNSLDVINLVVEYEITFDIEVQEADLKSFQTVGDMIDYIEGLAQTVPAHA